MGDSHYVLRMWNALSRKPGGQCVALFYPDLIGPVKQGPHLLYRWDGARIEAFVAAA